ncbi:MAG TPA: branched-chain amino acid ABC transporter permease [Nitriliruptorales bacterium]|nr:branched-chain amino acid ABC transporter permease [Nitriliruptorales bacterium]
MTRSDRLLHLDFVAAVLWAVRIAAVVVVLWGAFFSLTSGRLTAVQWRDLIVFGIAQGSVYALIALGYTMVYGVLGFINFAHGEVFMSGAMVGFFAADALFRAGLWASNPFLSLLIVLVVSMATSTLVAVLLERVAYRRLRAAPRLIPLITSIGASFFLQYAFRGLFGAGIRTYPSVGVLAGRIDVLGVRIATSQALVIAVAIGMMVGLYQFVERTKAGRALRAVAEDKEIAALMGVNVDRTIVLTFAVGGAMAGVAGLLWGVVFRSVFFFTGFLPGIKAFTAAVLGGIGNIVGAMVGGLALGIFESLGPSLVLSGLGIPSAHQLKDVVAFTALVLVLIFRPTGLLGERLAEERA